MGDAIWDRGLGLGSGYEVGMWDQVLGLIVEMGFGVGMWDLDLGWNVGLRSRFGVGM